MATRVRKDRSESELQDASNDVYYEFWMFVKLANVLATGVSGESILNNALLESFTVHAKAILNFLYNDSPAEDDVAAVDFAATPADWIRARPKRSALLREVEKDIRRRVIKELAQLTYDRHQGQGEKKPWPFMQIAKEVNAALDVFLELVPKELLGPRWHEVKQHRKVQSAGP